MRHSSFRPHTRKGAAFHDKADLWPPGTSCVFELPTGTERVEPGPVPLAEWILLALCAAAALTVARLWHLVGPCRDPRTSRAPNDA
jgi:hypothetical protein